MTADTHNPDGTPAGGFTRDHTYLLIHGGGSSARYWDRVVHRLDRPAVAVDLPGRGARPADLRTLTLEDMVDSVIKDTSEAIPTGPIVVIAHSSGGIVVPGVVEALRERILHIVLNAALAPREGERALDCMRDDHRVGLEAVVADLSTRGEVMLLPGATGDLERFRTAFGGEPLDDDTFAMATDPCRLVPDTVAHYFEPVHWSRVASVPVTYVLNEHDRPVSPERQEEMTTWLPRPPRVVRLPTGHCPALSDPGLFAETLAGLHW